MDLIKTIDFSASKEYLDKLYEVHNKILKTKYENAEKINKLEIENEEMKQRLLDMYAIKTTLQEERTNWQLKLQNIEKSEKSSDLEKHFDSVCRLLGFTLSDLEWDTEHSIQYVKCSYNKEFYVKFGLSPAGAKDLIEIHPTHPNFEYIQDHFRNTQDSSSLLVNLRKYFIYVENAEKHIEN